MVNNFYPTLPFSRRHCALCGIDTVKDLCLDCSAELPRIDHACTHCGIALVNTGICGRCLIEPPAFLRCISPLLYEAPVSHLLGAFKYQSNFNHGRILSGLLIERLQQESKLNVDALIPVPLHWRRRWQRGFNQAELIADELQRTLHLPLQSRWLSRVHTSAPQQSLDAEARRKNLRHAFICERDLQNIRIALIDDVVTTGATANAIAKVLLASGAVSVEVWCLARTPYR